MEKKAMFALSLNTHNRLANIVWSRKQWEMNLSKFCCNREMRVFIGLVMSWWLNCITSISICHFQELLYLHIPEKFKISNEVPTWLVQIKSNLAHWIATSFWWSHLTNTEISGENNHILKMWQVRFLLVSKHENLMS